MEWTEIAGALALMVFVAVMFPATKNMVKNSPKGSSSEWMGFALVMGVISMFIILLIGLV